MVFGAVIGAALTVGVRLFGRRRHRTRVPDDPVYAATRFAAVTHIRRHGSVSVPILQGVLDVPEMTIRRYLERMISEGLIRGHGDGQGAFYTRS